jgi:hypothetical protein
VDDAGIVPGLMGGKFALFFDDEKFRPRGSMKQFASGGKTDNSRSDDDYVVTLIRHESPAQQ